MTVFESFNPIKQLKKQGKQKNPDYKIQLKKEKEDYKPLKAEFIKNGADEYNSLFIDNKNKKLLIIDTKKHSAVSKEFSEVKYYNKDVEKRTTGVKSKNTFNTINVATEYIFTVGFNNGDVRTFTLMPRLGVQGKYKKIISEIENALINIINENNDNSDYTEKNESGNDLDQLTKLKELADAGVISTEEFEAKKKQILRL